MSAPIVVLMEEEERSALDAFRAAGATSAARAQLLADLNLQAGSAAVRRFVRDGVLRPTGPGTYYLDEAALRARRRRASGPLLVLIAGVVAGALAALVGTRSRR